MSAEPGEFAGLHSAGEILVSLPIVGRPDGTPHSFDPRAHYALRTAPTAEFGSLPQTDARIRNIGWTLGNDCPYRCIHCYSMSARDKGRDMTPAMVDRVIAQLRMNGVETVNLGGNEPLFTNGLRPQDTLLPYIIDSLVMAGIEVGLTTSGISLLHLHRNYPESFRRLNDVDVSLDSPFEDEHNRNRGARLFNQAISALRIAQEEGLPHSCIMAAMSWNFSEVHIAALVALAKSLDAHVRINPVKPVEPQHLQIALPPQLYYRGFAQLFELCDPVDIGEPPLAAVTSHLGHRCPCGRSSFRIHSITPQGRIHVSPCVYLHDYKSPLDLLESDLGDIIDSPPFVVFRQRNANPEAIEGCSGCRLVSSCGGGCAARSFLHTLHETGTKTLKSRDPYCPAAQHALPVFPQRPQLQVQQRLVHMDYLCTWIGRPV